jgi:hypothetical protein
VLGTYGIEALISAVALTLAATVQGLVDMARPPPTPNDDMAGGIRYVLFLATLPMAFVFGAIIGGSLGALRTFLINRR